MLHNVFNQYFKNIEREIQALENIYIGYRYHFQNKENCVIFRYDNTPHFPKIKTFPHHKHLMNGKVIDTEKPSILKVIGEATQFNAIQHAARITIDKKI
ncbi:hypothetical protein GMMP13_970041 [Candidatus Magnetomoraceae bacterium gMMP-13]